jgi:Tfp pilus assembly protein PilO
VNVSNIKLAKPRQDGEKILLDASCTATTFRFLDEAERQRVQEQQQKKANGGKGA